MSQRITGSLSRTPGARSTKIRTGLDSLVSDIRFRWWALEHGKGTHWECQRVDTGKQSIHRHSRLLSACAEHTNQGWYSLGPNQHAPHLPWRFYSQFSRMSMSQNLFEFLLEKRTSQQNSIFSVLHGFLFVCFGLLDWVKAVLTWEFRLDIWISVSIVPRSSLLRPWSKLLSHVRIIQANGPPFRVPKGRELHSIQYQLERTLSLQDGLQYKTSWSYVPAHEYRQKFGT